MVDAVNTVGGATPVAPAGQATVSRVATTSNFDSAVKTLNSGAVTQNTALSARILDDPLGGVLVSQQIDAKGQVVQQTPSSSVLAYLRNGLTIEGLPKQTTSA